MDGGFGVQEMDSMIEEQILFSTEVGSWMWGMNLPDSDHDIINVYAQSTREILSGHEHIRNKPNTKKMIGGIEYDYQYMEIGHLVNLLIKGNVNAIWAVTSPRVYKGSYTLCQLREITVNNLSKASYPSIHGLAISNLHDNEKRPNMRPNKAYKQCLRTLKFGINMFKNNIITYEPITHEVTKPEIDEAFIQLKNAFDTTTIMVSPDEPTFRNFLYNVRTIEA
jgi:predicted nucleotidyltransferase